MKYIKESLVLFSIFIITSLPCQADEWAITYGGLDDDWGITIQQTIDEGYIVAGQTRSFGAGDIDFWVLKLNSNGTIEWEKTYGGLEVDRGYFIQQTSDGGYILMGSAHSFCVQPPGGELGWLLKLKPDGTIDWQKVYGNCVGSGPEITLNAIQETSDGGFITVGSHDDADTLVSKLKSDGTIDWQKLYVGAFSEFVVSIQQTSPDDGYILAGTIYNSVTGDKDAWILKLESDGTIDWQKSYSGNDEEEFSSIQQTTDGGFILSGNTDSFGPSSPAHSLFCLKLKSDGTIDWQKYYGGSGGDFPRSIQQVPGDGYILVGQTNSFGAGGVDGWILKLKDDGNIDWEKTYGASNSDWLASIHLTIDGGYAVSGHTRSFGAGMRDMFILKLNENGEIPDCNLISTSNAIVGNTSFSINVPNVVSQPFSATATDTEVTPLDSSAERSVICYFPLDTDGDGIPDYEDACPNSDLSETVTIDGCDSGVQNVLLDDGCTISDLISQCADGASNHGQFTSGVSHMTNFLKKDSTISGKEKGEIQSCAASADIP